MLPKCLLLVLLASFIVADNPFSNSYQTQSCPHPRLEHGRVRIKLRSRLVKFMCASRYELVGDRYATCRAGQWDAPKPVCVRSGCEPLPVSPNSIQVKEHRDAWVVTFCLPGHRLVGSPAVYCDGYKWNATAAPACVDATTTSNLNCDFEEPDICGWTQDELHDFDWKRWNKKTPSSFVKTGPSYDHTYGQQQDGYYMYIESTARDVNETARLLSPVYDSSLIANGCFSFFYHMLGKDIGGLRVYQKPNSLQLTYMLNLTGSDQKYLLFEKWGNQGDFWYSNVSQLIPMDEDFQIVIEGIRGRTFISDIAIDDVSILQGDQCTVARLAAVTPTPPAPTEGVQSCVGRCDVEDTDPAQCGCTIDCVLSRSCCPDFLDVCFMLEAMDPTTTETLPETQKLVGETTTTTASTTVKASAKPSQVTSPIVKTTKASTTTAKPTTTTLKATTTPKPTTPKPTTTKPTTAKPTTVKPTTAKPTTTPETTVKVTTRKVTTAKLTTVKVLPTDKAATKGVTVKETTEDLEIEKKKSETEVNLNKMGTAKPQTKSKSSTWKTAVITIVLLALSVSLIYVAITARTARGRQAIARLRGRTNHDSEVRYLNSANDDDL